MHGGVKLYHGSAGAARADVDAHGAVLEGGPAEGGVGELYAVERDLGAGNFAAAVISRLPDLDSPAYERWVAGLDGAGTPKGRLREDARALRFIEVVINGPKGWSIAAALHPRVAQAYDAAQGRAAAEILRWVGEHSTTRVGPRGGQVHVPVERMEAVLLRRLTSRAGDPHRHLRLQISTRVVAAGGWRGVHSAGIVGAIEALNGIGHAAVMCDPEFRAALAAHGYTLRPEGEVVELEPYVGVLSRRAHQIAGNIDRYEAHWRREHPGQDPGAELRRRWDRMAWDDARPAKGADADRSGVASRWDGDLRALGFIPPEAAVRLEGTPSAGLDPDAVVEAALRRMGARPRKRWTVVDVRGAVEWSVAAAGVIAAVAIRRELVEDLTDRTFARGAPGGPPSGRGSTETVAAARGSMPEEALA